MLDQPSVELLPQLLVTVDAAVEDGHRLEREASLVGRTRRGQLEELLRLRLDQLRVEDARRVDREHPSLRRVHPGLDRGRRRLVPEDRVGEGDPRPHPVAPPPLLRGVRERRLEPLGSLEGSLGRLLLAFPREVDRDRGSAQRATPVGDPARPLLGQRDGAACLEQRFHEVLLEPSARLEVRHLRELRGRPEGSTQESAGATRDIPVDARRRGAQELTSPHRGGRAEQQGKDEEELHG